MQFDDLPDTKIEDRKASYKKYSNTEKGKRIRFSLQLKHKYQLTLDQYYDILNLQNNNCALCRYPLRFNVYKDVCIDHCHRTNRIRGIVHRKCNLRLQALDDYNWMIKAIDYLGGEPWK